MTILKAPEHVGVAYIQGASPAYIQMLLDRGAVISGAGSETRDISFFRDHHRYVYLSEGVGVGRTYRRQFPATAQGLINMVFFALYHGAFWGERL